MSKLPYSRAVKVTVIRNDKFPAKQGFGTSLFLTTKTVAGQLDATHRTKLYSSIEEVAVDFIPSDSWYKGALVAFSQNPRPIAIKAGWIDATVTLTPTIMLAQLDLLYDFDTDFYFVGVEAAFRDSTHLPGLTSWIEAKSLQAMIDTNDADLETSAGSPSLPATLKGTVERSSFFYHTDATQYVAWAAAATASTFNFDEANSAYTLKWKHLESVQPINLASAKVQAITGFVPEIGESTTAGNCVNAYIDIGDQDFLIEGTTLTPNVFIDEIHTADWIVARTREEMLGVLLNNQRVPFTDEGMEMLAGAVRTVMAQAKRAGFIASDINEETGEYQPAVVITVPSALSVPASQRKARIAPVIQCQFRYAGAVHYAVVRYEMNF